MTGIRLLACLASLIITQTGFVCSELQFLQRGEGESVLLSCAVEGKNPPPYGVYLKSSWLRPREVLFKHTGSDFSLDNDDDRPRVIVSGDPSSHSLNVTISDLSARDTDHYYCEFMVSDPSSSVDQQIRGNTDFFLLVNAGGQCGCFNYSILLYALSSAVVILLILLLTFVALYKSKARRSVKSPQAPIYEEMTGASGKRRPRHLEETNLSEYTNCHVKKSCPENHYESPISTWSEAQK
ncbi:cd7 antigen-like [Clinocottus analis]|uniref:cd7 antigen-like n=1 Tax=Clinocottus analis TaxID=304258 RepID=UPI0035BEC510